MRNMPAVIVACAIALGATATAADAVTTHASPDLTPTVSVHNPISPVTVTSGGTNTATTAPVGSGSVDSGGPMIPYPAPGAFGFGKHGIAEFTSPPVAIGGSTVVTQIANFSGSDIEFGLDYTVQFWDGAHWIKTDIAPQVFPMIEEQLASGQLSAPQRITLPQNPQSGLYRVTTTVVRENVAGTGQSRTTKIHGYFEVTAIDTPQSAR